MCWVFRKVWTTCWLNNCLLTSSVFYSETGMFFFSTKQFLRSESMLWLLCAFMAHTHQCKLGNYEQAGGYKWSFAMVCALKFMQKLSPLMNLGWSKNCILAWKVCVLGVQQKKLTGLAVSEVDQPRSSVIYRLGTLCMRIWNTGQQNTLIKILMEISICKEANFLFVCLFGRYSGILLQYYQAALFWSLAECGVIIWSQVFFLHYVCLLCLPTNYIP